MDPNDEHDHKATLQFYLNNQEMIRYHGERMWDSMKIFGIIVPAITGILTLLVNSIQNGNLQFGKEVLLLFGIPIAFTIIFWWNAYRENLRFLEYALMSWKAEKMLGFHDPIKKLENDALILDRFKDKPRKKPGYGKSFWMVNCLFFGASLIIQIILAVYFFKVL